MPTIGVYIITKNEEHDIRQCLESVQWADEIVLVDDFSTDKTLAIARQFKCKILQTEWRGYGKQKQFALDQLTTDWALNVDADERVTPELAREIQTAVKQDDRCHPPLMRRRAGMVDDSKSDKTSASPLRAVQGYEIPFVFYFLGHRMRFGGCGSEKHLRLFRRAKGHYDKTAVHETLAVEGKIGKLRHTIEHHSYKDGEEYFTKFDEYTSLAAKEMYQRGKRAHWYKFLSFPWELFRRVVLYGAFLDGAAGVKYAWYSSLYVWTKYRKLRKLYNESGR